MIFRESVDLGGRPLTIEVGRFAKQANGSAWIEYGDSRVLVTACMADSGRQGIDFFPMTVDYMEKLYAVGRIPGGFIKRETRPQKRETLTSRLIDRPIRPLFPEEFKKETQIIATVYSADLENETDAMAMIGASAALMASDMPFTTAIAGVKVGLIDGEYVCNPTPAQMEHSRMNIFMAASSKAIVMVEGESDEVTENEMVEGLMKGFEWVQPVIQLQERMREAVGKEKIAVEPKVVPEELKAKVRDLAMDGLKAAIDIDDKLPRYAALKAVKNKVKEELADLPEEEQALIGEIFGDLKHHYVRGMILDGKRIGKRALNEVREITVDSSILPRVHGSAMFRRGETMALVMVTLGTQTDSQRVDDMIGDRFQDFMLDYSFPPFSVGEVKRVGSPGRREIGHGTLAERALMRMIPKGEDGFPYTIRVASEILESNGSSSMATVCGGCLAMMDAGVPIKKPVAGIAMGMIKEGDRSAILTDILGDEDHLGDMDFKVCGTRDGITALQMDLKVDGIDRETLSKALAQAKDGRLHILGKMLEHLPEPREKISAFAPRIVTIHINPDRIRDVIGQGGKTIREIVDQTGCQINVDDDGSVVIASPNESDCQRAVEIVQGLTEEPEIGKVYKGKVKRITDFGAFVEIIPGLEGLLHISEVSWERTPSMEGVMALGDIVDVKLLDMERNGKLRLSMKALQPKPEGYVERPREDRRPSDRDRRPSGPPRGGRNDRGGRGGPRNR